MIEFIVVIITCVFVIFFILKRFNDLNDIKEIDKSQVFSHEENVLLSITPPELHRQMINYIRNMEMSNELQDYINSNHEIIEALSYFMSIKFTKADIEKKEKFNLAYVPRVKTYYEKKILASLKNNKLHQSANK